MNTRGRPKNYFSMSPRQNRWPAVEESFGIGVQKWRRKSGVEVDTEEQAAFLDLIRRILIFQPEERLTAEEVLHPKCRSTWGCLITSEA